MADQSQYSYSAMSNLVTQADPRFVSRRTDEATGDPESLAGRLSIRDMGSRIARDAAPKTKKMIPGLERGSLTEGQDVLLQMQRKRKTEESGVLGASEPLVEGIRYRPRTAATKETFNLLLTLGAKHLGDVPHEVVRSAVDAVLEYLKDDDLKDFDKKKEIDDILGKPLSAPEFSQLVSLGKKITDYDAQDDDEGAGAGSGLGLDVELDDRQGVAVTFDEGDDEDELVNEVRDESSDDGGGGDEEEDEDEESHSSRSNAGDQEMVIESELKQTASKENFLPARDLCDPYWLQRQIGKLYPDPHELADKTKDALRILSGEPDEAGGEEKPLHEIENDLMELFNFEHNELVQKLAANREKVFWLAKLARAEGAEARVTVEREIVSEGLRWILDELQGKSGDGDRKRKVDVKLDIKMDIDASSLEKPAQEEPPDDKPIGGLLPCKVVNLDNLVFDQGNHLMTNADVKLPDGTTRRTFKGYEEIHVPIPKKRADDQESLIPISRMPEWSQTPFSLAKAKSLNKIQSACYPSAFEDDGNMLICAPTGSGKTNVAMLAMLREIGKNRNPQTGDIDLDAFKIIYIAPLKALVQEQVGTFGTRLAMYGIKVAELTGDRQLTKQQIAEAQVIVTTPEKWDVITRKATDLSYTSLVRLIIIDEIHLLHDDRGPVLESIVSRTIRKSEQTDEQVRIIGLSATLPNYVDVAHFLRVDLEKGLFHFDGSYRPCPLRQEFVGVTDRKPIKQLKIMNDVTYTKVIEHVSKRKQMLIFVHSRKETARTARYVRDKAIELDTIGQIIHHDASSRDVLNEIADGAGDRDLKDILPYGFGIHHAGMSRADREDVEALFKQGHIQVLVCTATLAWGVNLPSHTVIIKGTQVYSPERGSWVELSPQDVLQMLGRAGRPQHDTYGEGIIITTQSEMRYYLSLMNQQLPIESQFISKLVDNLNAEVVLGNVRSRDEAVEWLGYTYLYVRMTKSPGLYQIGAEYEDDKYLEQKRVDLVHSAALVLQKSSLIKYDEKTGKLSATELGRIASHYYITYSSMDTYNSLIQPGITTVELFRVFSLSQEFKFIPVRQDEKVELAGLLGKVPIPVKESIEESHAKINVLLQAYISRLKLEGLALMADMIYITQSAGRILRAIFEISLKKGWSSVALTALDLCKMAEKRMWPTMSPLRQFPDALATQRDPKNKDRRDVNIIQKVESMNIPWESYFGLDPPRMGELLGGPRFAKLVCGLVAKFPRLDIRADCEPMTKSMLRIRLTITPNFEWDDHYHGASESFWIVVEDCDGDDILYHDQFLLRKEHALSRETAEAEANDHYVDFTVPITEPMPPHYFVSVVSDRWMHSTSKLPIVFQKLILPEKFPPHTELLHLQPLPVSALHKSYQKLYPDWDIFNKIQTQTFNSLYKGDENVFVGAPTGSGKTMCAEFAILRHWLKKEPGPALYVAPYQQLVDIRLKDWEARLGPLRGGVDIVKLTGDVTVDLELLGKGDLILATPTQWDVLSRQWRRRKNVQAIELFIADEIHLLGGEGGGVYEVVVSRMHYMRTQTEKDMRIIALGVSLANARDLGEWIGAAKHDIYNFSPQVRPVPLELNIQSFSLPHFPSLMLAMAKPAYLYITQLSPDKPAIVFVPNRKQTRLTSRDLMAACHADHNDGRFLHVDREQLEPLLKNINEGVLAEAISHGIGYYHEALSEKEKRIVKYLYDNGAIQVLVASRDVCWELDSTAHLVIVMGTQFFNGVEHRYLDYPLSEVLQMFGKALRPSKSGGARGALMVPSVKRDYYKKFLTEALPVESQLLSFMEDAFVSEISTDTIQSGDEAINWTTFTYFYRRLLANPSYYNLPSRNHDDLSNYMSDLIESTLRELSEAKIVEYDEEEGTVADLNSASKIAAYYNISYLTMQTFLNSLGPRTKLKGILEIVTAAHEFESIQMRRHEENILGRIYSQLPVKISEASHDSPHFKAFVLLQAHFSRMELPVDLAKDQETVLIKVIDLLSAMVDIFSSEGRLNALRAMEMSQMVIQAMWDRDSPLKQLPYFTPETIKVAEEFELHEMSELIDAMDSNENNNYPALIKRLGLTQKQLAQVADFTNNKWPDIELKYDVVKPEEIRAGETSFLNVQIARFRGEGDEEDEGNEGNKGDEDQKDQSFDATVHAPYYPITKVESWWLVVADRPNKSLLRIKRVPPAKELMVKMPFEVAEAGKHDLSLILMSGSYVGADVEVEFSITAAEGMDTDADEDEDENEEE